jgi:hypothetical protein
MRYCPGAYKAVVTGIGAADSVVCGEEKVFLTL